MNNLEKKQHALELLKKISESNTFIDLNTRELLAPLKELKETIESLTFGINFEQEPKYTTDGEHFINRVSGEIIPIDEPVFLFRARDALSAESVLRYAVRIVTRPTAQDTAEEHYRAVMARWDDFRLFAKTKPERMKYPDTKSTLPPEPKVAVSWNNVVLHP